MTTAALAPPVHFDLDVAAPVAPRPDGVGPIFGSTTTVLDSHVSEVMRR